VSRRLVIASWNIQKGIGVDLRSDFDRTARVLRAADADIIGLQEVLRVAGMDQAEGLARELGMMLAWGPARPARGGTYGNALLVRGTVESSKVHDLSVARSERRACLEALITVNGQALRVYVCHFGLGLRERARQAARLLDVVGGERAEPRVVLGDFNEWHRGPVYRALRTEFPRAPAPKATHPSPLPLFALDRIAWDAPLDGDVHVVSVGGASDHRMLCARLHARKRVESNTDEAR
jgi:endonuclease/exonuclease/phosphatase family metal-dependent hydrolase